jgi:nuclear transport factor 2 (NTF2) superfamily protein
MNYWRRQMKYDEVIQEVWRIKEEIAVQYNYDVHEYAAALREKRAHAEKNVPEKNIIFNTPASSKSAHAATQ